MPDPTRFQFRPATIEEAHEIAEWRYPEPYSSADPAGDPDVLSRLIRPEGDPQDAYAAIDALGDIASYLVCRRDYTILDLSLGLRPTLIGRGHGWSFLLAALLFAKRVYAPNVFRVTIAADNDAARYLLQDADFVPVDAHRRSIDGVDREFQRFIRKV